MLVSRDFESVNASASFYTIVPAVSPSTTLSISFSSSTRSGTPDVFLFFPSTSFSLENDDLSVFPLEIKATVILDTATSYTGLAFSLVCVPEASAFRDLSSGWDTLTISGLVTGSSTSFEGVMNYAVSYGNSFYTASGGSTGAYAAYLFHSLLYGFSASRFDGGLYTPADDDLTGSIVSIQLNFVFAVF